VEFSSSPGARWRHLPCQESTNLSIRVELENRKGPSHPVFESPLPQRLPLSIGGAVRKHEHSLAPALEQFADLSNFRMGAPVLPAQEFPEHR
jgi:hypothetical protein